MVRILEERKPMYYQGEIDPHHLDNLKEWVIQLENMTLSTESELSEFIARINELSHKLKDSLADIYTAMTCNTADKILEEKHNAFHTNVIAYYAPKDFAFKSKILASPILDQWIKQNPEVYSLLKKWLKKDVDFFREENIPLAIKESEYSVKYRSITGSMTVNFRGEEKTLPELAVYLKDGDRSLREEAWFARAHKMQEHKQELNDVFDKLYELRIQIAKNTGYQNYRDYAHHQKGRFAYTVEDVLNFQEAVEKEIVPLVKELNKDRQKTLGVDTLRPWDLSVSLDGKILKPVEEPSLLADKGIEILSAADVWTGDNFASMQKSGLLDLLNRKNKAPGGYSYPLYKYGASFIFMNAVGIHSDLTTLVHEAGHAMHEFASAKLPYTALMEMPMEGAELASMSMEMLSMPHWNLAYNTGDYKKAVRDQIEDTLRFFPWCVTVDGFQHKIYTEAPDALSREKAFVELSRRFSEAAGVDWSGLEAERSLMWLFQLHIFEVPFYYIEYGIAQLGALAMYRQYKKTPAAALENYKKFLHLGPTAPLKEMYKTAGIELNFTRDYVKEIVSFVREELAVL